MSLRQKLKLTLLTIESTALYFGVWLLAGYWFGRVYPFEAVRG